jgi:NAD(P)H-hydrate epimerase
MVPAPVRAAAMSGPRPPLRPFGGTRVWAHTGAESADIDMRAIRSRGVPQSVLMENAGRSAAAILSRLFPSGPVVGLVGAGNNGGDALVLLRTLRAWGRDVEAVLVADRPEGEPLLHGWSLPVRHDDELDGVGWAALLGSAAVVVDGVLGTGARGAPRKRQAAAVARMNACGRPVLALDVPSGVDASTGAVPAEAVRATVTVVCCTRRGRWRDVWSPWRSAFRRLAPARPTRCSSRPRGRDGTCRCARPTHTRTRWAAV